MNLESTNFLNQLRPGNYISDLEGNLFCVTGIDTMNLSIQTTAIDTWYNWETFKFIPLTADWLEKFGFVKTHTNVGAPAFKLTITDYRLGNMVVNFGKEFCEVEYCKLDIDGRTYIARVYHVHQLMNLHFALTGTELQIK